MDGVFVSFEGGDGCGKSTQIALLTARLESAGRRVLHVREPGGTPAGEVIRHLLKHHPANAGLAPEAELLLFAASRAQLVRERIAPALAEGAVVLADRFLDSTTVYQGDARGLPAGDVARINDFAVGSCRPHLTILLDLDAAAGLARAGTRQPPGSEPDRLERESPAFHESVRRAYLRLAAAHPERIRTLDATRPPGELHAEIVRTLTQRYHGLFA